MGRYRRTFLSNASSQGAKSRSHSIHSMGGDPLSSTLHILSWNVDGLDKKYTVQRASAVCDIIRERKPEVVYLQEVVNSTWKKFQEELGSAYFCYRDDEIASSWHYYCALLIRRHSAAVPELEAAEILRFPQSQQNRYLLQMPIRFGGVPILLLTSHLESLNRYASERKNQLKTCFGLMEEAMQSDSRFCILGGDLNLMEKEVAQIGGLPESFYDAWEKSGSDEEERYTWDSSEPRFRLDRLICCPVEADLTPAMFELVGREVLSSCGGAYPSDHLGIWAEFERKS